MPGLDIIAAVVELSAAEVELTAVDRREFRLAEALRVSLKSATILIDCPPSLGLNGKCALCCKHCLGAVAM